jgi:CHAT domain-containing protein
VVADASGEPGEALPRFRPDPRAPYAHPAFWAPFVLIGNWR